MKTSSIKTKKLPKSVKRITILRADGVDGSGGGDRVVVRKKKKKKKQSKGLTKIFERMTRRTAKAGSKTSSRYLSRHNRSNRKRRDGWVRDLSYNMMRAGRTGGKEFQLSKLFG